MRIKRSIKFPFEIGHHKEFTEEFAEEVYKMAEVSVESGLKHIADNHKAYALSSLMR